MMPDLDGVKYDVWELDVVSSDSTRRFMRMAAYKSWAYN